MIFPFRETDYYRFGVGAGMRNLWGNGFSIGLRKTIGKISQPINSYARFPEYYYMAESIGRYVKENRSSKSLRILDVGSPKCFGLYVAANFEVEGELTDISRLNLDEYELIWKELASTAKGEVRFAAQDVRRLDYGDQEFDIVYSMSVIEHVEGQSGDSEAIREMVRVLRPGGLLLASVPFSSTYIEQHREGFAGAIRKTGDEKRYFFQRIYDRPALTNRILRCLDGMRVERAWTVWRRNTWFAKLYGHLGENVRGVLGFVNPWLSAWLNLSEEGIHDAFESRYSEIHSPTDVLGDVIIEARKVQKYADG